MKAKAVDKYPGSPDFVVFCPACQTEHGIWTTERNYNRAIWKFNNSLVSPTFAPSVKITIGHHPQPPEICHFFIRDGKIEYCDDCTHAMAGRTVELPEFNDL
jgi:hypothetical protein